MIPPWTPRGPSEPRQYTISLLVVPEEYQRDAIYMAAMMVRDDSSHPSSSYYANKSELSLKTVKGIKLRGGWGIVSIVGIGNENSYYRSMFNSLFIDKARAFNVESGWDYAWWQNYTNYGHTSILAGKSKSVRGTNLRDVIGRSWDDIVDGSYREKGVDYGTGV